jgi:hypothetical protein
MANYKTGSQRYNDRMDKIMADARRIERERLARGEKPNPNLTSPEEARQYGWNIRGRDVTRLDDAYEMDLCFALREFGFAPYHRLTVEGRELEVISMPFPKRGSIGIMLREPDEPGTLHEFRLWDAL